MSPGAARLAAKIAELVQLRPLEERHEHLRLVDAGDRLYVLAEPEVGVEGSPR